MSIPSRVTASRWSSGSAVGDVGSPTCQHEYEQPGMALVPTLRRHSHIREWLASTTRLHSVLANPCLPSPVAAPFWRASLGNLAACLYLAVDRCGRQEARGKMPRLHCLYGCLRYDLTPRATCKGEGAVETRETSPRAPRERRRAPTQSATEWRSPTNDAMINTSIAQGRCTRPRPLFFAP